jgi:putative SOS response-associated peptidase YedK
MCNRYRFASVTRIRDAFGFTYIEDGPDMRDLKPAIGPLQLGPFIRGAERRVAVGQWGLIPDGSPSRRPQNAAGRPISTNNARWDSGKGEPEKYTFKPAWWRAQRCLIPAEDFDEPYWGHGGPRCIWWRFRRRDGMPWALAGLWNEWTDPATGEIVGSYTMLTINCNAHPLLSLMHKPDLDPSGQPLPPDRQDKRTVVPLEREHWDTWLHGTSAQAAELMRLAPLELYEHGAVDGAQAVALPL